LPNQPRNGIIINLPEMRLYYFPVGSNEVFTYPIGIGKVGKTIPIERTAITHKTEHPTWTPPDDIREFNLQQGIVLPKVMPPGPDNPLGPYAIYMQIPTYLIHSTIFPESVGRRASFGCIRMYETDIKKFFPAVSSGIPVAIINSPVKIGWQQDHLYIEAYPALEEHSYAPEASLAGVVSLISHTSTDQPVLVDWQAIAYISQERDGIPHEVGVKISQ
ncbi:MAG: L,D-transpeptidase family protein, partial [Gammaproteobacteria bacterium]|nr:L,D-transpeptidase family protein [Gammaproteobacteria bacterium]